MPLERPVAAIEPTSLELEKLTMMAQRRQSQQQDFQRARIVLLCAEGLANKEVARPERVNAATAGKWRGRLARERLAGLVDAPRAGAPRTITDAKVEALITKTLEEKPAARTHWSSRLLAKQSGISEHSVQRIWRAFGLKPPLVKTCKLSKDPMFIEKVRDIGGLSLNPPEQAIVLCVDEKSQTRALERSQPTLPLRPGLPERQTHDYVRHGATSLFASYNTLTGQVMGHCHQKHRHQEVLRFPERIEAANPDDGHTHIHLVMDNDGTHKVEKVRRWFLRHPRYHVHDAPTGSSWLDQVERFFGKITQEAIRRGSFTSVNQLKQASDDYLQEHNQEPQPFV